MSFKINGYEIASDVISQDAANILAIEFQLLKDYIFYKKNINANDLYMGDALCEKSFSYYAPHCFESLLLYLQPIMENIIGKPLYPCYSYARIYNNGAIMARHTDRPSCQYSASITISVDETGPWEIWIKNLSGEAKSISIPVGSMLVYSGDILEHWREDPYKGKRQIQAFLHYVDVNGIYADHKFDERIMIGLRWGNDGHASAKLV